jgi:hypothetical protein
VIAAEGEFQAAQPFVGSTAERVRGPRRGQERGERTLRSGHPAPAL